jgi:hypothetical protein
MLGSVLIYVDYTAPVERIREKFLELVKASKLWDGQTAALAVTDAREGSIELRALMSARNAGDAFDLRSDIREKLIYFLQREMPTALPHARAMSLTPPSAGKPPGETAQPATASR